MEGISLQTKSGHIACALMKHPLATAEIFLFNIGKSVETLSEIIYKMMESLKEWELCSFCDF